MRTRILKDLRMLLPLGLQAAAGIAILAPLANPVSFFIPYMTGGAMSVGVLCFVILALAGAMAGVLLFTHEFTHQRMNWLLAQPVSRTQLWVEKCLALAAFLIGMLLLTLALGAASEVIKTSIWQEKYEVVIDMVEVVTPQDGGIQRGAFPHNDKQAFRPMPGFGGMKISAAEYMILMQSNFGRIPGRFFACASAWMSHAWNQPITLVIDKNRALSPRRILLAFGRQCAITLSPFLVCMAALAYGGLWMGLCLRQTPTAFAATLVTTFIGVSLIYALLLIMNCNIDAKSDFIMWGGVSNLLWFLCATAGSFIQFKRLEV